MKRSTAFLCSLALNTVALTVQAGEPPSYVYGGSSIWEDVGTTRPTQPKAEPMDVPTFVYPGEPKQQTKPAADPRLPFQPSREDLAARAKIHVG